MQVLAPNPISSRKRIAFALRQQPTMYIGIAVLVALALMAIFAPWIAPYSPTDINPLARMKPPSAAHIFGTDALGRDIFSRVVWGARVSLVVGIAVALLSVLLGVVIGMLAGYFSKLDMIIMRIMDGLMAIPNILLAIALMAVFKGGLLTVIAAIIIPEVPRVVRLVRALVMSIRNQPYVEAAHALGTRTHKILVMHILPNLFAPLMVQATFIAASAIITEAVLSFLGVGIPPQTPSWGNIMADGRNFLSIAFHIILFPGLFLAMTVLAVNMLGDGLRDMLDPKLAKKI
ncbi:ABC transporter permease [Bordetella sp. 02P26C-1]|uniref:ABC transporter permease n=1 Tax=Bordetella sp. 02P26C-1 TaxID=2683195 RepID=UPI0013533998|nr:ABC transporter permease [Bordetella sp. 02P26C-1]MVW78656.1 ABC transporter permease subunit [Bordetella sp. 02P26C-1]